MTKLKSQVFSSGLGLYRLNEDNFIVAQAHGQPGIKTVNALKDMLETDDVAEIIKISAHAGRWTNSDMVEFCDNPEAPDFRQVARLIRDYLVNFIAFADPGTASLLALWIIGTYVHQLFNAYPYLHINGPAGSGKTKILTMLAALAYNPIFTGNISVPAMFRVVEGSSGTILFDEAEILGTDFGVEYRLLLNSGYKKGSCVYRMEGNTSGGFKLREFDTYSPKAIASIGRLPHVLTTRCLEVATVKLNSESANRLIDQDNPGLIAIRNMLYRSGLMYYSEIHKQYMACAGVSSMSGRERELWAPLKAIEAVIKTKKKEETQC